MKIDLLPGVYVAAVSGGVDSMVLLELLTHKPGVRVIVAHFDHGIREDSVNDRLLVARMAARYGYPFVYDVAALGAGASEAVARKARYDFLHKVRLATGAQAILTAHHQDDIVETAIINIVRGTNRRGLSSLKSVDTIERPLLRMTKQQIIAYAKENTIKWHEDTTNVDEAYLRNYIRKQVIPKFSARQYEKLLTHITNMQELNEEIDALLISHLHLQPATDKIDRHWFISLPHTVAREIMASWLRYRGATNYDKKTLERLVAAAKTYQPGKQTDINNTYVLKVSKKYLALHALDR